MESIYDREITHDEELLMRYRAEKRLNKLGYSMSREGRDILFSLEGDKIGRLTHSKEEGVPIAIINRIPLGIGFTSFLDKSERRRKFKENLLDLGWAVSLSDININQYAQDIRFCN